MRTRIVPKLAVAALLWSAVACDTPRSTSPGSGNGAFAASGSLGVARNPNAADMTIVLVHGAFAGALAWQDVIGILQREGYRVIAVENPLTDPGQDVATTKRVIDAETQAGRAVVVVGHSYGGYVITGAAAGNPKVKALVYVAAFAPEASERVDAFLGQYPSDLGTALIPDATPGFLRIAPEKFHDVFAADLPEHETDIAAAAQKPIVGSAFGATVPTAAWKTIPSWYVVSRQDHALNPDLERFYASRMASAHTLVEKVELNTSHVGFISRPMEVARVILEAAAR